MTEQEQIIELKQEVALLKLQLESKDRIIQIHVESKDRIIKMISEMGKSPLVEANAQLEHALEHTEP